MHVLACVQSLFRSVCPHRSGAPKQIFELSFLGCRVGPLRGLDLDLRLEHDGVDRFRRRGVRNFQFEIQSGVSPRAAGSTPVIRKPRSGTGLLLCCEGPRAFVEPAKEAIDLPPGRLSSRKASPVCANQADQLKTEVDGHNIIIARRAHPVDQKCLDVRFNFSQSRVIRGESLPGCQRKQRFRGASRARIEGRHFIRLRMEKEEGEVYREGQVFPLGVVNSEVRAGESVARNELESVLRRRTGTSWRMRRRSRQYFGSRLRKGGGAAGRSAALQSSQCSGGSRSFSRAGEAAQVANGSEAAHRRDCTVGGSRFLSHGRTTR